MEDGEIEGTHPEEPTAPGHQTTEALPPSAALGDRPASKPDERAGRGAVNYNIRVASRVALIFGFIWSWN